MTTCIVVAAVADGRVIREKPKSFVADFVHKWRVPYVSSSSLYCAALVLWPVQKAWFLNSHPEFSSTPDKKALSQSKSRERRSASEAINKHYVSEQSTHTYGRCAGEREEEGL